MYKVTVKNASGKEIAHSLEDDKREVQAAKKLFGLLFKHSKITVQRVPDAPKGRAK